MPNTTANHAINNTNSKHMPLTDVPSQVTNLGFFSGKKRKAKIFENYLSLSLKLAFVTRVRIIVEVKKGKLR